MAEQTHDEHLLEVAEDVSRQIIELSRRLTPEGWDRAYYQAMFGKPRWHTMDCAMLRDIRLISMRATVRFR